MNSLDSVFYELSDLDFHRKTIKKRIAKIILGASVIRVFEKHTKEKLLQCLLELEIDSVLSVQTETEYDKWHYEKVISIYDCLYKSNNEKYSNDLEGLMWGHSTKIFNLFIGHLFYYSFYFNNERNSLKAQFFFHVPLDSKVFSVLKSFQIKVPKSIKSIQASDYKEIQKVFRDAAQRNSVAPLLFDDYAWAHLD